MRFGVLGPLAAWDGDGRGLGVPEAKVRALLADLLVHGGGPVSADRLVEDLWAGSPPGRPLNALQTKVSQLRRVLGRDRVVHEPGGYRLVLADGAVDAWRFQELVERAGRAAGPGERARLLADALALWRGEAYADVADAPFVREEATRLAELRLTALEEQAEARLELGEHAALAAGLGELVARHPLRERLRAAQLRALYRSGRQGEAIAGFHDLRARLADELGVTPGPELSALYEAMLRQEPMLAAPSPCCRTNLPTPLTRLIGRDGAVAEVREALANSARLLTLTGPGGVGKTRLAVAAAGEQADRFPDGVWLVELAGVDCAAKPDDIAERVSTTLGLCDVPDPDPVDVVGWLRERLGERRLLLVLDNAEHVVDSLALLAEALLTAGPGPRLLVTSREPLDVPGEVVFPVPPLALPEGSARSSAVDLFVERAAAAGTPVGEQDLPAVSAICRRLDGIPLALELVVPGLRVLTPAELAVCLDNRFDLPSAPRRAAPARHRTLRAMIDWSWDLLSEEERKVLRRIAIHADSCTVEAAEAVSAPQTETLTILARLVDSSLLIREGPRFRLPESVAAYALTRLTEAEERSSTTERFVQYYTELANQADQHLTGPNRTTWLTRLDEESANLHKAKAQAQNPAQINTITRALAHHRQERRKTPKPPHQSASTPRTNQTLTPKPNQPPNPSGVSPSTTQPRSQQEELAPWGARGARPPDRHLHRANREGDATAAPDIDRRGAVKPGGRSTASAAPPDRGGRCPAGTCATWARTPGSG